MCKNFFCILIILLYSNTVLSQDKINILLEYKMVHVVDTAQPANPRITRCMLIAGSKMSVYDDYYRAMRYLGYKGDAAMRVYDNQLDIAEATAGITCDQIFTDLEKRELITGSYFGKALYTMVEPLTKIEWTIQPQKKKILEQNCQKATTYFRGREYIVWFAPAIPINAGPWKLNGLPGIILAANDEKNEITFTCTKITIPEEKAPLIKASKNATLLSTIEFNKTKQKFANDPQAFYDASDPMGSIMAFATPIGFQSDTKTKSKPRPLNNPIEKE